MPDTDTNSPTDLRGSMNMLLASLAAPLRGALMPHMRRVALTGGATLGACGAPIRSIHFVECGVVSCSGADTISGGIEIGMVGREGVVGASLLLGAMHHPYRSTVCLSGGSALAIDAEVLRDIVDRHPDVRAALNHYLHYFHELLSYCVVSAMRDQVEARLARRLLMLHDRIDGDEMSLTHNDLSGVLNVRRATVTDCLHILEGEHVVTCSRGRIAVRDRAKLESAAGNCYGAPEATYRRMIGNFGKPASPPAATRIAAPLMSHVEP